MFHFLQYAKPAWYYRLYPKAPLALYGWEDIREGVAAGTLVPDAEYRTKAARVADMAYQALRSGHVPRAARAESLVVETVTDVQDNYRFLRKHFHAKWSLLACIVRVLTGHNPIREIAAFAKSARRLPKAPGLQLHRHEGFRGHAARAGQQHRVSVIIPTLNRYAYLRDVLADLEQQTYRNFEVVVCDQSDPCQTSVYDGWTFPVKVLRQEEKALWKARNSCILASEGSLILLFDDDSRVGPDWIQMHVACLTFFGCEISAGVTDTVVGNSLSDRDSGFHYADVFDTGNALLRRSVFEVTGLFDRQFERQRMGDGEFGLRCYLSGFPSVSNPHARRTHLKIETGGLREFGSWDAFRPRNLFSPRPVPSVLYFTRKYFGDASALMLVAQSIVGSVIPYQYKNRRSLKRLAILLFIPVLPIVAVQVIRSWRLSGEKLRKGPLIDTLPTTNIHPPPSHTKDD